VAPAVISLQIIVQQKQVPTYLPNIIARKESRKKEKAYVTKFT